MSTLTATIQADTTGFNNAVKKAMQEVNLFNKENKNLASTMKKVSDVTDDQVKAFNKSVNSLKNVAVGNKTTKQSVKILSDELEKLNRQFRNLSDTAKSSGFGTTLQNTIKSTTRELQSLRKTQESTTKTGSSFSSSLSALRGTLGKVAGGAALAGAAIEGISYISKETINNFESLGDRVERFKTQLTSVKDTAITLLFTNNFKLQGGFIDSLLAAADAAGKLADAFDRLGTVKTFNSVAVSELENKFSKYREIKASRNLTADEKKALKEDINMYKALMVTEIKSAKTVANTVIKEALTNFGVDVNKEYIKKEITQLFEGIKKYGIIYWDAVDEVYRKELSKHKLTPTTVGNIDNVSNSLVSEDRKNLLKYYAAVLEKESKIAEGFNSYIAAVNNKTTANNTIAKVEGYLKNKNYPSDKVVNEKIKNSVDLHAENTKLKETLKELRDKLKKEDITDIERANIVSQYATTWEKLVSNREKNLELSKPLESPLTTKFWRVQTDILNATEKYYPEGPKTQHEIVESNTVHKKAMLELADMIVADGRSMENVLNLIKDESNNISKNTGKSYIEDKEVQDFLKEVEIMVSLRRFKNEFINYESSLQEEGFNINKVISTLHDNALNKQLNDLKLTINAVNDLASAWSNLWSVIDLGNDTINSTMQALGKSVQDFANMFVRLAEIQVAASKAEALGKGTASAAGLPFPYNLAAMATVIATVTSMFASFASIGKFAEGGIVGGNRSIGDYNIARVNSGEMILNGSQQKRLFHLLNSNGTAESSVQKVELVVRGKDLVGAIDNYNRQINRVR